MFCIYSLRNIYYRYNMADDLFIISLAKIANMTIPDSSVASIKHHA